MNGKLERSQPRDYLSRRGHNGQPVVVDIHSLISITLDKIEP